MAPLVLAHATGAVAQHEDTDGCSMALDDAVYLNADLLRRMGIAFATPLLLLPAPAMPAATTLAITGSAAAAADADAGPDCAWCCAGGATAAAPLAVGRTVPTQHVGRQQVGLGPDLRASCGAAIGDTVAVYAMRRAAGPATRLLLRPLVPLLRHIDGAVDAESTASDSVIRALRIALRGHFVVVGSCLSVTYLGRPRRFVVQHGEATSDRDAAAKVHLRYCDDADAVAAATTLLERRLEQCSIRDAAAAPLEERILYVSDSTQIGLAHDERTEAQPAHSVTSLDDVGGLDEQIALVREAIELPLRDPERLRSLGISPLRGVLLYGPPGTGKTLIARAVSAAAGVPILCVNGPEVVSRVYGESEARLRAVFAAARSCAPSIVFIDELDALCPRRTGATGDLEQRMVGTLMSLMDALSTDSAAARAGHVVVIAASNRPDAIDEALRRSGRLDREIEIGIPTATQRLAILRALLRAVPNSVTPEQLRQIADDAHGHVGADLAGVCREAGLVALQRCLDDRSAPECVTVADLCVGLARVRPSAMREVVLDIPHVRWSDIGGQADIKERLCEAVEWPLRHPELFAHMGIRPPKGLLLYGPPGCSKTLMAKALATESRLNFIAVKGPELFSKWVGESERAVREVFRKARAAAPSIVFFDEIDALAVRRGDGRTGGEDDGGVANRVLSQLLTEMDGVEPLQNVTIVAATNRPDMLDEALLRPGRIDRILYVPLPDAAARLAILEARVMRMPHTDDVVASELAARTAGYSGAEIVAVCREAVMNAMDEADEASPLVGRRHFLDALARIRPQTTDAMLRMYTEYQKRSRLQAV